LFFRIIKLNIILFKTEVVLKQKKTSKCIYIYIRIKF
jgi:hypothetical protein